MLKTNFVEFVVKPAKENSQSSASLKTEMGVSVKMKAGAGRGLDASIQTGEQAEAAERTQCNQRASVRNAARAPPGQPLRVV